MSQNENKDQEKFHVYDGIIEHDNPLPTWWLWTFFFTIIFAFLYFIHYSFSPGMNLTDELAVAMKELEQTRAKITAGSVMETEESLTQDFDKEEILMVGAAQFSSKCASCHGAELQGLIGPNLTDKYWLHGQGTRMDLLKVIREGVPEKGMPPWGPVMKKEDLYAVAAFIRSKRGTNPPSAKEAQGPAVADYLK